MKAAQFLDCSVLRGLGGIDRRLVCFGLSRDLCRDGDDGFQACLF